MNLSLSLVKIYKPCDNSPIVDFKTKFDIIVYFTNTSIIMLNESTDYIISNISCNLSIITVDIIDNSFILYANLTSTVIYDFRVNQILFQVTNFNYMGNH